MTLSLTWTLTLNLALELTFTLSLVLTLTLTLTLTKNFFDFGDKNYLETAGFLENGTNDFAHFFTESGPQQGLEASENRLSKKV